MNASGFSEKTSTRTVVAPSAAGLPNPVSADSCRKNGASSISKPTTPPRFHSSVAPSARLYQSAAAGADGTASISEICGPVMSHRLKQVRGQRGRPCQCYQVPAGQHVSFDAEPVPGEGLLPANWEEAVIGSGHDVDRNGRPGAEVAHRRERRVGLRPLIRFSGRRDIRRDVVEEVAEQIKLRSVATLLSRGDSRL